MVKLSRSRSTSSLVPLNWWHRCVVGRIQISSSEFADDWSIRQRLSNAINCHLEWRILFLFFFFEFFDLSFCESNKKWTDLSFYRLRWVFHQLGDIFLNIVHKFVGQAVLGMHQCYTNVNAAKGHTVFIVIPRWRCRQKRTTELTPRATLCQTLTNR